MNNTYIYFIHKGDNIPCYIGKTVNPISRLKNHKSKNNTYLYLEVIDEVQSNEWKFWEEWYIELFYSWGFNLENKTRKGRGCGSRPCNWSEKISNSNKGKSRNFTPQEIKNRSNRALNNNYALGYKYNISQLESCSEGRRKVYHQYDLQGNFIKKWYSTKIEISNYFLMDSSGLTHHLKGRQKSAYGFIWKELKN